MLGQLAHLAHTALPGTPLKTLRTHASKARKARHGTHARMFEPQSAPASLASCRAVLCRSSGSLTTRQEVDARSMQMGACLEIARPCQAIHGATPKHRKTLSMRFFQISKRMW
eukprot:6455029-Amphidinium_carterae.1